MPTPDDPPSSQGPPLLPSSPRLRGRKCPSLAVLGTMSDAGKSTIAAGLCRLLTKGGLAVAPFKAQNMSNNSAPALLPEGSGVLGPSSLGSDAGDGGFGDTSGGLRRGGWGEIGTAQATQAKACRQPPRVEMNPVLLKSGGRRSSDGAYLCSVIVLGRQIATEDYGSLGRRSGTLMDLVIEARDELADVTNADVIVVEGAGSCTELNLMDRDIVNIPLVRKLGCPWILVANIDPGGVFAQIVGTKECLPPSDWDLCACVVVNKLRGETKYFDPGPAILEELVGKPIFVVPYLRDLHLPEEDGLGVERRLADEHRLAMSDIGGEKREDATPQKPVVVVLAYPHVSIADDLTPLESDPRFTVEWRRDVVPPPYPNTTAVILPGSRLTRSDLAWLHSHPRWVTFLRRHAAAGGTILGLCGGYQMLGLEVADPGGAEGEAGTSEGLRLLPVRTVMTPAADKVVTPVAATIDLPGGGESVRVEGFELHCGRTELVVGSGAEQGARPLPLLKYSNGADEGACVGQVRGTYMHGILGSAVARRILLTHEHTTLEDACEEGAQAIDPLDRLAEHLAECGLDFDTVSKLIT